MATALKYRRRRQVILDESGYSDDGLYSEDDYKPPVSYLLRRRNAICVSSITSDKETPAGTAHVLSFLKQKGIPPMRQSKSEESDLDLSSDDDSMYTRKVSEELKKKNLYVQQLPQLGSKTSPPEEQSITVGRQPMYKAEKMQMPGFLKIQQKVPLDKETVWGKKRIDTPTAPPSSVKDVSTAIGKLSLLSNKMPRNTIQILNTPNSGVEPV